MVIVMGKLGAPLGIQIWYRIIRSLLTACLPSVCPVPTQLVAPGDGQLGAGLRVQHDTAVLMARKHGDTRHVPKAEASEETSQLAATPTASFTTSSPQTGKPNWQMLHWPGKMGSTGHSGVLATAANAQVFQGRA